MHFFGIMGSFWVCLLVALLVAVASDSRRGVKRDWLHYVGVGLIVAEAGDFFRGFGTYVVNWWLAIYQHILP